MTQGKSPSKHVPTPEQIKAADPQATVWVAAIAGSGKTQVLTDRLLRLLLTDVDPQSILCLTYTKAAATEMAARLFQRLSNWVKLDDEALGESLTLLGVNGRDGTMRRRARRLFARTIETPGGLKIQTIHAFAERLLQLFPVESGLAPGFRVMDDVQRERLMKEALSEALVDDAPGVPQSWELLAAQGLRTMDQLHQLAREFLSRGAGLLAAIIAEHGIAASADRLAKALAPATLPTAEEAADDVIAIDAAAYRLWAASLESCPVFRGPEKDPEPVLLRQIANAQGLSRLVLLEDFFLTQKGLFAATPIRKKLMETAGIDAVFLAEKSRIEQAFIRLWSRQTLDASRAAALAMAAVEQRMVRLKQAHGLYDFDDLIARTAHLLSTSETAQWVLYKLDKGLTHVLLDEAQDTSPGQWQIITALAREFFAGLGQHESQHGNQRRTVFVVGDRKQSIYSFQGADVRSFDETHGKIAQWAKGHDGGLRDVDLTVSYRSFANILAFVDTVFAPGSVARQGFGTGRDEGLHQATRKEGAGIVEVWPLVRSEEVEEREAWSAPVDQPPEDHPRRRLARKIALTVKGWIGQRRLHGASHTVRAEDILILVQRRNLMFTALLAEFRRLGVPVAGADRLTLNDHIITHDLLALAQALLLPDDDHALACVLKSPLVPAPVDDAILFDLAHGRAPLSLRQRLDAAPTQRANAEALNTLAELSRQTGPFLFFSKVIAQSRRAILRRLGSEAEDVTRAFLDQALAYEQEQGPSLSGFCHWLRTLETDLKREMSQPTGEVRIMTVHGSKGLEAPVVILADAADVAPDRNDSRLIIAPPQSGIEGWPLFMPDIRGEAPVITAWKQDRKAAKVQEHMRLFYVAMTRARDELYVCGSAGKNRPSSDSWWHLAWEATAEAKGLGFRDHVLSDGETARRLGPDDEPLIEKSMVTREDVPLPTWLNAPVPPTASLPASLAREAGDGGNLQALRRGIAIHKLLEAMADWPPAERRERALARARRSDVPEDLARDLVALMERPDLAPFFAGEHQAEVEISGILPDGERVLGRIDRLARHGSTFYLLDYKSGHPPAGPLAAEQPGVQQLARYAALLREAHPGAEVKAALLWTQRAELSWIPVALLD